MVVAPIVPTHEVAVYCGVAVGGAAGTCLIFSPLQPRGGGFVPSFPSVEKRAVLTVSEGHKGPCCHVPPAPPSAGLDVGVLPPAARQQQLGVERVEGRVWSLARDAQGSRAVQSALEAAEDDRARAALAAELRGHVLEAVQCPHANYVLQKCIASMGPQALQFVVDEILCPQPAQALQVAKHKYGCRILQRLLEHCRADQLEELVAELTDSAVLLARHPYANFVLQCLFEHGSQEQQHRLVRSFEGHAKALGKDDHGRAVLSKALMHSASEDRASLAQALLQEPGLLGRMACTRHGHAAVMSVLAVLQGPELARAHAQLLQGASKLRASRYGRAVVACMAEDGRQPQHESSPRFRCDSSEGGEVSEVSEVSEISEASESSSGCSWADSLSPSSSPDAPPPPPPSLSLPSWLSHRG